MGIETGLALLGGALLSGGASAYSANKQAKAQQSADANAQKQAKLTADAATEATNRANQKKPNAGRALSDAAQAAQGGVSGTMLTGPNGIDLSALQLGKTTLLGG